jgi:hypothetical protein
MSDEREIARIENKIASALDGEDICLSSEALFRVYTITFAIHCLMHGGNIAQALERELPLLATQIKENADDVATNMTPLEGTRFH